VIRNRPATPPVQEGMRAATLLLAALAVLAGCAAPSPGGPATSSGGAAPARAISPAGSGGPVPATTGPDRPESPGPVPAPPTPPAGTGVTGVTVVDAGCPVSRPDPVCADRPIPARLTVVDTRTGAVVATLTTGTDGVFRVALPPGTYELRPANLSGAALPRPIPVTVVVPAGRYVTQNVRFDTGIR
jgi:hypothetical protein